MLNSFCGGVITVSCLVGFIMSLYILWSQGKSPKCTISHLHDSCIPITKMSSDAAFVNTSCLTECLQFNFGLCVLLSTVMSASSQERQSKLRSRINEWSTVCQTTDMESIFVKWTQWIYRVDVSHQGPDLINPCRYIHLTNLLPVSWQFPLVSMVCLALFAPAVVPYQQLFCRLILFKLVIQPWVSVMASISIH